MVPVDKSPTQVRRNGTAPSVVRPLRQYDQQSLALELPTAANDEQVRAVSAQRLWLCIDLPALPLEAVSDGSNAAASAVFADQDGIRKVLLVNGSARSAGVSPGLSVNAALALLPTLQLEERDLQCEAQALLQLADWAGQFTSMVVIEQPACLLLELAGSLQLFGGLRALRKRIVGELSAQGFSALMAIAPTPLAATWLARAGRRSCVQDRANLAGALSPLPLVCLNWPMDVCDALNSMGVNQIGECLRLPRAGFAKRFGAARLLELDRALGRLPDPRQSYRSQEQFIGDIELPEELHDSELILKGCNVLLERLEHFLLTRQQAVQRIEFSFFHLRALATMLPLGCVQPDRALQHWSELLRIRFERLQLAAPVIAIRLRAGQGQTLLANNASLQFNNKSQQRRSLSIEHLVERLAARIGDDAVHGVMTVAEHRPQYAWARETVSANVAHCPAAPMYYAPGAPELLADIRKTSSLLLRRPLWILPMPETLAVHADVPHYQGRLQLEDGPERLESGWWDDDGIARDYYVASNASGVRLWVFRDRSSQGGWFLHGIFG